MDILALFNKYAVHYVTKARHLTSDDIAVRCPKCFDDNNNFHINIEGKGFYCWKCGFNGKNYGYLLYLLTGIRITLNTDKKIITIKKEKPQQITLPDFALPLRKMLDIPPAQRIIKFLTGVSRNFPINFTDKLDDEIFNMYVTLDVPDDILSNRIIIPFTYKGVPVSFSARSYTLNNSYKHYNKKGSIVPLYNCDYLEQSKKEILVVHESALDAFKWNLLAENSIATAVVNRKTNKFQELQLIQISMKFELVIFILDNDTVSKNITSRTLTDILISNVFNKRVVTLNKFTRNKDFGELSVEDSLRLIHMIESKGEISMPLCIGKTQQQQKPKGELMS